jgi:ethanolaminephosphotransferase
MDIVYNIFQTGFKEDNWVYRAKDAGYRLLFYGDDIWFTMFTPETFLERSEGTTAFFITDYTTVDTNITRYLEREFSDEFSHSWDFLLLHFLGLDHIGKFICVYIFLF